MKFALQALFQTFFLEVSRGSFLCERAAPFEVDIHKEQHAITRNVARVVRRCAVGAMLVVRWCGVGTTVVRALVQCSDRNSACHRNGASARQRNGANAHWEHSNASAPVRHQWNARARERQHATHLHQHLHQCDASAAPEQCGSS